MNRYRSYGRLDDPIEVVGDAQFLRLDMRTDPATLPQGVVQVSENMRFDSGGARVRRGVSRQLGPGITLEQIRHACVYRPDNSNDNLALLCEEKMYLFNPSTQAHGSALAYPKAGASYVDGERILSTDAVQGIQAGMSTTMDLYILRGLSKLVLVYTGGGSVAEDAAFTKGEFGVFYQDRMAVNATRQSVGVSDFLDFTTWSALTQFTILKGGDDRLMGLKAWQKDYVIIGTAKRFYIARFLSTASAAAGGYEVGLDAEGSFLHLLTEEAGLLGQNAWIEAGGAIWFLTHTGIYAFQPRLDLELTVLGDPISAPIQPVINRMNADAARNACFARLGHRIYVALPMNSDPIKAELSSEERSSPYPDFLFIYTGDTPHGMEVGDQISVTGANQTAANGIHTVATVVDATRVTVEVADGLTASTNLGGQVEVQRLQTRNNVIAVYNLANQGWESIDLLPTGLRADWLLTADYLTERRLWLVDRDRGPCLYEQGDVDEMSGVVGGVELPFTLPRLLSEASYEAAPVAGRLRSRSYRWGPHARKVLAGEARMTMHPGDTAFMTVTVRTPDLGEWTSTRTVGEDQTDTAVRKRCGRRGLEAEIEITSQTGRPAVRHFSVETAVVGRVKEE